MKLSEKIFGTHSSRELKRIMPLCRHMLTNIITGFLKYLPVISKVRLLQ